MSLMTRARPVLALGIGITLLGFVLMFVAPALGFWLAVPGMVIVVACGLLAFGTILLSLFGKRPTHG